MWNLSVYATSLSDKLRPRWTTSTPKILTVAGVSLAAIGLSAYLYLKAYYDWLIDDIILIRGAAKYGKKLPTLMTNGVYDPVTSIERNAKEMPDKPFLLYEDQKHTFAQTNAKANQVAQALQHLEISRNQNMAVLMRNKPELLFLFYGCLKVAVPLSFINTNLRNRGLMHCIRESQTKNLVVDDDPEMLAAVDEIATELKSGQIKVYVYGKSSQYESLSDTIATCGIENIPTSVREGITNKDILAFLFTSGTTGLPKAVKVTYYRWTRIAAVLYIFGLREDDILYSPLPLYHGSTLLLYHAGALFAGVTFSFAGKFSVSRFWEDCIKHKATIAQYIGETCRYLLARPPSEADKKHKVRLVIGNGLRKDIWNEFQTRFKIPKIGEFYGATEGNALFANMRNKFGACGRKSPATNKKGSVNLVRFIEYDTENDVVVRGEDGLCKVVPLGKPGLLVSEITSVAAFDGYADSSQTDKKILRNVLEEGDTFFNTGDILLWDTDYYVYFVDRIGDTFRWKGENVSTQEVATMINELDIILDCTVYGVSIPGMDGKCGMGAVVLNSGTSPTEANLMTIYRQCEQLLPPYARPIFIRFMSALHLTGTYKHQKFQLQKEGFDYRTVPDVYVHDIKKGTYTPLTADVYDSIVNGSMKV